MKRFGKKFYIIGGLVIVVGLVAANFLVNGEVEATSVQADIAYHDEISEIVTASGRIQPKTKVNITSEVSAEIVQLTVKEGDFVTKGTPLLLLDTIQYKSDANQAKYSLDEIKARAAAAESQFNKDKKEYDRQQSLFAKGLSSETLLSNATFAYENSKANFDAYKAQVKTVNARLNKSLDNLSKTVITAPMDGVIIYLSAEVGEIAQAQTSFTQGKTLMTIADLAIFEVEVEIDETQIANVSMYQDVDIRVDAFDDSLFTGVVTEIGNSATMSGQGTEEFTTAFKVIIKFDETNVTIRPGMSATVDITTASEKDALLVPYASVILREFDPDSLESKNETASTETISSNVVFAATTTTEDETSDKSKKKKKDKIKMRGVYVINNGTAAFKEIITGIADERNIVVIEGITPGDTVISGSFKTLRALKEGDVVEVDQYSIDQMNEGN